MPDKVDIAYIKIWDILVGAVSWDPEKEARLAYGSNDARHPMVSEMGGWGKVCISGKLKVINLPKYYDFVDLRRTPAEVRKMLEEIGHENVVAFQTRNPLHRVHEELTKRRSRDRRQLVDPSGGWHDQARRCGSLYPRTRLQGALRKLLY